MMENKQTNKKTAIPNQMKLMTTKEEKEKRKRKNKKKKIVTRVLICMCKSTKFLSGLKVIQKILLKETQRFLITTEQSENLRKQC